MDHPSDDDLEKYAMGKLPEAEGGPIEEHLLFCELCRERLDDTDEFVAAMKAALAKIRKSGLGEE